VEAVELHRQVEEAFNAGDAAALASLYEPGAQLLGEDGSVASGIDEIGAVWASFVASGGRLTLTTRSAFAQEDLALLSNEWKFELDGMVAASGITAEVARRQRDGSWKYVIDNPYAAPPTT
jgi:uncharacterized protein (TIGR02246 family)